MSALDQIWAGWRAAYVADHDPAGSHLPGEGSVFHRILQAVDEGILDDESAYVVHRSHETFAILNAYPYGTGHLLVLPYRQVGQLEDLTESESTDLWAMVNQAVRAVKAAYKPDGVNVGMNLGAAAGAGIPDHLHAHVLPRWDADSNFMTSVANARVLPEDLGTTWRKLHAVWPD